MAPGVVARMRDVLTDASEIIYSAPRWRSALAFLLSLAGLGVSTYLTVDHFAKVRLACADTGVVNCQKVTTSAQSHFLGIPVAVLGLAFFVAMTLLNLPAAWRAADRRVHPAPLVVGLAGRPLVLLLVGAVFATSFLWLAKMSRPTTTDRMLAASNRSTASERASGVAS